MLAAATFRIVLFAAALPAELVSTFCAAAVEALVAALPMPGATNAKVRLMGSAIISTPLSQAALSISPKPPALEATNSSDKYL